MKIEENSYLKYSSLITEISTGNIYFDQPDFPRIEEREDDIEYIIEERFHRRPDKLANELYGDVNLVWILAIRNNWDVPSFSCIKGAKIIIPSPVYVSEEILA